MFHHWEKIADFPNQFENPIESRKALQLMMILGTTDPENALGKILQARFPEYYSPIEISGPVPTSIIDERVKELAASGFYFYDGFAWPLSHFCIPYLVVGYGKMFNEEADYSPPSVLDGDIDPELVTTWQREMRVHHKGIEYQVYEVNNRDQDTCGVLCALIPPGRVLFDT
jgi:hypothetical protein